MTPNDSRRSGEDRNGGDYYGGGRSARNVVRLPGPRQVHHAAPFNELTVRLVMAQARAGTLNPEIVAAMLLGIGLLP